MKKCLFVLAMLGMVIYAVSCAQTEVNTAGDGTCLAENDERTYAVQEHFEHTNETDCLEENNDSDFLSSGNDAVLSDEPVCGGVTLCPVHPVEFHSYSSILINYVGGDVFAEWIADNDNMAPTIEGAHTTETFIDLFMTLRLREFLSQCIMARQCITMRIITLICCMATMKRQ